jgi:hypothetical protein
MAVSAFDLKLNVPHDVKYIGDLMGSYLLSSRQNSGSDQVRIFGCRSRSVSPQMAVLQAPVKGAIGETLTLKLDTLGVLGARVARNTPDGFIAELVLTKEETAKIARRIDWLKQKHLKSLPDRRDAKRWLPRDSHSSLILADKREIDCFIIDVSSSGAAVSADAMPGVGHPVVVGTVLGRVVRMLEYGFAVQFLTPREPQTVEHLLVPPKGSKRELLERALAEAEAAYEASHPPANEDEPEVAPPSPITG